MTHFDEDEYFDESMPEVIIDYLDLVNEFIRSSISDEFNEYSAKLIEDQ
jgi:hypothetical protein